MPTYYQLSQDEIDIIKAIRKGDAKVVLVPKSQRITEAVSFDDKSVYP